LHTELAGGGPHVEVYVLRPQAQQAGRQGVGQFQAVVAQQLERALGCLERRSAEPGIELEPAAAYAAHGRRLDLQGQVHEVVVPARAVGRRQVEHRHLAGRRRQLQRQQQGLADVVDVDQVGPAVARDAQVAQAPGLQPAAYAPHPQLAAGAEDAAGPQQHRLAAVLHEVAHGGLGFAFGPAVPAQAGVQRRVFADSCLLRRRRPTWCSGARCAGNRPAARPAPACARRRQSRPRRPPRSSPRHQSL
jgi:hypothetical protein